jgi:hypothetical protein
LDSKTGLPKPLMRQNTQQLQEPLSASSRLKSRTVYQDPGEAQTNKSDRSKYDGFSSQAVKAKYQVKENAIKGVYVHNLNEVDCTTAEQAYMCLLKGLMKKRVSQTIRNTASSRSHTIFQIKMYLKPIAAEFGNLHPKYYDK